MLYIELPHGQCCEPGGVHLAIGNLAAQQDDKHTNMETQHQNSAWNVYERVGASYTINKSNEYFFVTQFKNAYSDTSQEY